MGLAPPSPVIFLLLACLSLALGMVVGLKARPGPLRNYFSLFALSVTAIADQQVVGCEDGARGLTAHASRRAVTADAQLWVASRLAALQRAHLSVADEGAARSIVVRFEAASDRQ